LAVAPFDLRGHGYFHETTHLSAELPVAIANTEEVEGGQALNIGGQDVLILVYFIGVVRVVANSGGECELAHAVLALFVSFLGFWLLGVLAASRLLACILQWAHTAGVVLGLCYLLLDYKLG